MYDKSHIVVPISPTKLFIAANNKNTIEGLRRIDAGKLVAQCNDRIVRQAVKYAYDNSTDQLTFISRRLALHKLVETDCPTKESHPTK